MATITTNAHTGRRAFASLGELGLIAASLSAFAGSVYLTFNTDRELVINIWTLALWAAGVFLALPIVKDAQGALGHLYGFLAILLGIACLVIGGLLLLPWIFVMAMEISSSEFNFLHLLGMPVFFGLPLMFIPFGENS